MLIDYPRGGYRFLKGISPYSAGVIASSGFAVEHVRLSRALPWKRGFAWIDARLHGAGRPRQALCAIALRSPKPFSFAGFGEFNQQYVETLGSWQIGHPETVILDGKTNHRLVIPKRVPLLPCRGQVCTRERPNQKSNGKRDANRDETPGTGADNERVEGEPRNRERGAAQIGAKRAERCPASRDRKDQQEP